MIVLQILVKLRKKMSGLASVTKKMLLICMVEVKCMRKKFGCFNVLGDTSPDSGEVLDTKNS
jgi:hypothetical protein